MSRGKRRETVSPRASSERRSSHSFSTGDKPPINYRPVGGQTPSVRWAAGPTLKNSEYSLSSFPQDEMDSHSSCNKRKLHRYDRRHSSIFPCTSQGIEFSSYRNFEAITSDGKRVLIHNILLGSGGEAEVWLATLTDTDGSKKDVAVKIFHAQTSKATQWIKETINYARLPQHKNVLKTYGSGTLAHSGSREFCFIVFKLMKKSLKDIACDDDNFRDNCTFGKLVNTFLDVAHGLLHVHSNRMVHGDVTPGNILIGEDGTATLSDFSLASAKIGAKSSVRLDRPGTRRYMAEEVWMKFLYDDGKSNSDGGTQISVSEYSDVYSLAKSFRDTLLWVKGTPAHQLSSAGGRYTGGNGPNLEEWFPQELAELLEDCTRFDKEKCFAGENGFGRPSCQEIIERLQSMKNTKWYHEVIQEYTQKTQDHQSSEVIHQSVGCFRLYFILSLKDAVHSRILKTAFFSNRDPKNSDLRYSK